MFRPIGEVFEDKGVKLRVKEVNHLFCSGCYYRNDECELAHPTPESEQISGQCFNESRGDNKNVIFKEV